MTWQDEASPDAVLVFAEVRHPLLSAPMRLVTDVVPYTWQGVQWEGVMFEFEAVQDDDRTPEARITLPAIDRTIANALIALPERARISFWILSSADFDLSVTPRAPVGTPHIYRSFPNMDIVDVRGNAATASGRLLVRDPSQEPWPPIRATQAVAPGLFF
jgi:hypothetical protein